ncbi:MAG: histidine phosphatase family protein [Cocleimonas sp.]|nr:histidine phosphatase family protein [Cocleimonas sp.]
MKITLLRHGKPDFKIPKRAAIKDIANAIKGYDNAGIAADSLPPQSAIDMANNVNVIICSHLPRSLESAKKLTQQPIYLSDALFREASLPRPNSNRSFPQLSAAMWLTIFRLLWLMGYDKNGESIVITRKRAKRATETLVELAQQHQHVLLAGHGVFNYLLAKELKKLGWKASKKSPREYWEYTTYES